MIDKYKNFMKEAHDKFEMKARFYNRSRTPWICHPISFLVERLKEELQELLDSYYEEDDVNLRDECKDISNFAWFIYESVNEKIRIEAASKAEYADKWKGAGI